MGSVLASGVGRKGAGKCYQPGLGDRESTDHEHFSAVILLHTQQSSASSTHSCYLASKSWSHQFVSTVMHEGSCSAAAMLLKELHVQKICSRLHSSSFLMLFFQKYFKLEFSL